VNKATLNTEELKFFRTVCNAAFANPFSELREKLDIKIAGLFPSANRRESIDQCILEVGRRINKLEKESRANINAYQGQDKSIISIVFLFDIFHQFRDDFDQLIKDQIKAQDTPIRVEFAPRAMQLLHKRGFD
jgi:hypothetical protein